MMISESIEKITEIATKFAEDVQKVFPPRKQYLIDRAKKKKAKRKHGGHK